MQKLENLKFKCRCSFLEIYNEQIADLLEPSSSNLQVLALRPDWYFAEFDWFRLFAILFHEISYSAVSVGCAHSFEGDIFDSDPNGFRSDGFKLHQMREDANKGVYVEGLLEVEVQNVQDVLHLLLLVSLQRV